MAPRIIQNLVSVIVLLSSSDPNFVWPCHESVVNSEKQFEDSEQSNTRFCDNELLRVQNGAIWIPETDSDLLLRLCKVALTGPSERRAGKASTEVLQQHYVWTTVCSDVKNFVGACIYCHFTVKGGKCNAPVWTCGSWNVARGLVTV